jgi:lipopolysaccharide heptosyltransferase I
MNTSAPSESPGPRVLAIKLSSLGDLFHALPAVQRLRAIPGARVDWVTQSEYAPLVACFGVADRVISFPRRGTVRHFPAFLKSLRQESYDWTVDFQGLLKSALIGRLARARERIGPSFYREGASLFYSRVAGVRNKGRHAVEENLEIADVLGAPAAPGKPAFRFPPFTPTEPGPRVAVIPLSRWESKNWPAAHFVEVLKRLQAERGVAVYFLGGMMDRYLCEGMAAQLAGPAFNLAGEISLAQMGGILKTMNLVLANDTGPMHMAAALDVPVLSIFGPTDEARTGPYGAGHRALAAPGFDCRPCLSRHCLRAASATCMEAVTPERAAAEALRLLG